MRQTLVVHDQSGIGLYLCADRLWRPEHVLVGAAVSLRHAEQGRSRGDCRGTESRAETEGEQEQDKQRPGHRFVLFMPVEALTRFLTHKAKEGVQIRILNICIGLQ